MISFIVVPWILAELSAPTWIWIVWASGLTIKVAYALINDK